MQERLPEDVFRALQKTAREGRPLNLQIADVVAAAMKNWALEKGATHYTHWFQPMTGITAEKHDSFLQPKGSDRVIMEFSGKELVRGEPDASSLPSGGLRNTFEARGYTAWDPTSYAFIKDRTLCIPTAFCSYNGLALDKKTPLLRSMEALNREAVRLLHALGNKQVCHVTAMVGAEQEYFLVDREMYNSRKDLVFTGRTLFGARAPKGQELEDHYFGTIKSRVQAFMRDLNEDLWALGVPAKTEHNETAPAQYELAQVYASTNLATDQNQITMERMKRIAERHSLACLLHEKPFAGVNGSGKHNNWSLRTDLGQNLFDPGKSPYENAQFLLFLCAMIQAVDDHQDLLRLSTASAGNDFRLGAQEAPPAIVSIFLGNDLTEILNAVERGDPYTAGEKEEMVIGVHTLPRFPRDMTDRNRTSPFAFTGNKFEFRMVGSSQSIACANMMLNTIAAEAFGKFADELEGVQDVKAKMTEIIRRTIRAHRRILFSGNNYDIEWEKEAQRRGLLNLRTTPDAVDRYGLPQNVALFEKYHVLNAAEIQSRSEILLHNYSKEIRIEAVTMLDMARQSVLPAGLKAQKRICDMIMAKRAVSDALSTATEESLLEELSSLCDELYVEIAALKNAVHEMDGQDGTRECAYLARDAVLPAMQALRQTADGLELIMPADCAPFPDYAKLLYGV